MELLIEIVAQKKGEEVYFYDGYADDILANRGATIKRVIENAKEPDTIIIYLSVEDELLELWEVPCDTRDCGEKLAEVFGKINGYVNRSKNEN